MIDGAWFVTGTDTGVGKTYVTAGLLAAARAAGMLVAGMKPVASGARPLDGRLVSDDALQIALASGQPAESPADYENLNPYCLLEPISPHIAADRANIRIDIDKIVRHARALGAGRERLLIEGAGGWYAPIGVDRSMADIARALGCPVLLVVGLRLGCLNHARLTREAIRQRGCRFAGWVANRIDPDFDAPAENLATLSQLLGEPPLAIVPHSADACAHASALQGALARWRATHNREIT